MRDTAGHIVLLANRSAVELCGSKFEIARESCHPNGFTPATQTASLIGLHPVPKTPS